jgi:hypothetical protein
MPRLPLHHILLETTAGVTLQGTTLIELQQHLGDAVTGIQPSVSWNAIVGEHERLRVTARDLQSAIRRWFPWEEVLIRAAHLLNLLGSPKTLVNERGRHVAELALGDDWPAKIAGSQHLLSAIANSGKIFFPMNEHGLLWILLDALREPWPLPQGLLTGNEANQRFARLVFIAADGMGLGTKDDGAKTYAPGDKGSASSEQRVAFSTARLLVAAGRLNERVHPNVLLVRSHEIFVELLGGEKPELLDRFKHARGMDMGDWIVGLAGLANLTEASAADEAPRLPVLNLGPIQQRPRTATVEVIEQLARRPEFIASRISELLPTLQPGELPTQALREAPVVQLDAERFLVTHDDFIKDQAEDGIFYALIDNLSKQGKGAFLEGLGAAIETYSERILKRCAAVVGDGGQVARIERAEAVGKRCDFLWALKDRAIYVEIKRLGLSVMHLHGRLELAQRLAEELGEACRQLLQTRRAIEEEAADVCPSLADVAVPARSVAVIVTQRPTFVWFSSRREVIPQDIREEWRQGFGAPPAIWSLTDLELLEAVLPSVGIGTIFNAIASDAPDTYAGLAEFLTRRGYRGPCASLYCQSRWKDILRATRTEL